MRYRVSIYETTEREDGRIFRHCVGRLYVGTEEKAEDLVQKLPFNCVVEVAFYGTGWMDIRDVNSVWNDMTSFLNLRRQKTT